MNKNAYKLVKKAEKAGWRIETRKSGHLMCFSPNGEDIVTISVSPKDKSSVKKIEAQLRNGGLNI
ncbi:MAG: hypothetical protein FJZ43_04840 [Candidatus Staskawiczbacteria bacterium]|nr:hypothetical protein [Candidatus Staskawiczbacteria bacterium]